MTQPLSNHGTSEQLQRDADPPLGRSTKKLVWRRQTLDLFLWGFDRTLRPAVVQALVAGPFGIYRGSKYDLESRDCFTLFHLPSRTLLLTLPRQKHCKQAAAELAILQLAWESTDPKGVLGPDLDKAAAIHLHWTAVENKGTLPVGGFSEKRW